MKGDFLDAATYFGLKGRLEALEEHAKGESSLWNLTEEKVDFEGMYQGRNIEGWLEELMIENQGLKENVVGGSIEKGVEEGLNIPFIINSFQGAEEGLNTAFFTS